MLNQTGWFCVSSFAGVQMYFSKINRNLKLISMNFHVNYIFAPICCAKTIQTSIFVGMLLWRRDRARQMWMRTKPGTNRPLHRTGKESRERDRARRCTWMRAFVCAVPRDRESCIDKSSSTFARPAYTCIHGGFCRSLSLRGKLQSSWLTGDPRGVCPRGPRSALRHDERNLAENSPIKCGYDDERGTRGGGSVTRKRNIPSSECKRRPMHFGTLHHARASASRAKRRDEREENSRSRLNYTITAFLLFLKSFSTRTQRDFLTCN